MRKMDGESQATGALCCRAPRAQNCSKTHSANWKHVLTITWDKQLPRPNAAPEFTCTAFPHNHQLTADAPEPLYLWSNTGITFKAQSQSSVPLLSLHSDFAPGNAAPRPGSQTDEPLHRHRHSFSPSVHGESGRLPLTPDGSGGLAQMFMLIIVPKISECFQL